MGTFDVRKSLKKDKLKLVDNIYDYLTKDKKLNHEAAVAALGNIYRESGFNTSIVNPNEGSFGLFQFYNQAQAAFNKWAIDKGRDRNDYRTQIDYFFDHYVKQRNKAAQAQYFSDDGDLKKKAYNFMYHFESPRDRDKASFIEQNYSFVKGFDDYIRNVKGLTSSAEEVAPDVPVVSTPSITETPPITDFSLKVEEPKISYPEVALKALEEDKSNYEVMFNNYANSLYNDADKLPMKTVDFSNIQDVPNYFRSGGPLSIDEKLRLLYSKHPNPNRRDPNIAVRDETTRIPNAINRRAHTKIALKSDRVLTLPVKDKHGGSYVAITRTSPETLKTDTIVTPLTTTILGDGIRGEYPEDLTRKDPIVFRADAAAMALPADDKIGENTEKLKRMLSLNENNTPEGDRSFYSKIVAPTKEAISTREEFEKLDSQYRLYGNQPWRRSMLAYINDATNDAQDVLNAVGIGATAAAPVTGGTSLPIAGKAYLASGLVGGARSGIHAINALFDGNYGSAAINTAIGGVDVVAGRFLSKSPKSALYFVTQDLHNKYSPLSKDDAAHKLINTGLGLTGTYRFGTPAVKGLYNNIRTRTTKGLYGNMLDAGLAGWFGYEDLPKTNSEGNEYNNGGFLGKSFSTFKNSFNGIDNSLSSGITALQGVSGIVGAYAQNSAIKDTSAQQNTINNSLNTNVSAGSNSDLLSQWGNHSNIKNIHYKDLLNGNDVGGILGGALSGGTSGLQIAGPLGGAIGGGLGLLSGIAGSIAARNKAKREANRLNKQIDMANASMQNKFINTAYSLENNMDNELMRGFW